MVEPDLAAILRESRANNGIDGISGLLTTDGVSFVQVLEGPPESVAATFERIQRDRRHTDIVVVSDNLEAARAFADWTMASLPGELAEVLRERLAMLLEDAPTAVRDAFGKVRV